MTAEVGFDNATWTTDGHLVEVTRFYDDGTAVLERDGEVVESRPMTADESARFAPPPDPLATLIADLAKATTLAQVRAAAVKAAGSA